MNILYAIVGWAFLLAPLTVIILIAIHTAIMRIIQPEKSADDDLTNDLALIYLSCLGENHNED